MRLGFRDWQELARAQGAIVRWSLARRRRPRGQLVVRAGSESLIPSPSPGPAEISRAREIALALDRAARFGLLRPKCLVRSLALDDLLRREGLDASRVRFGVRKREGVFEAHAWVEFGEEVLADDAAHVASYAPVPGLQHLPEFE